MEYWLKRFNASQSSAKTRHIEWALSFEEFKELASMRCTYCGRETQSGYVGLDRMNNSKGYTLANATPCCMSCNRIKGGRLNVKQMLDEVNSINDP